MKTIFVTGAGGFAGSRSVEHLRTHGYDVVAGVRNRARKLAYERQGIRSLVCDVADPINVARAIASVRPDGVIHLAGPSAPADAIREPIEAFQGIAASWVYVLDAVRRASPRARILLVSGSQPHRGDNAGGNPGAPRPTSLFSGFKAVAESLAREFNAAYQLDLSIARPYWYTGPNQSGAAYFPAALRRIMEAAAGGQGQVELAELDSCRDLMHVDDLVAAYERILVDGKPGAAYDVCTGRATSTRELLEWVISGAGLGVQLVEAKSAAATEGPAGAGDPVRLRDELHWQAPRTGHDALADLWASLKSSEPQRHQTQQPMGVAMA